MRSAPSPLLSAEKSARSYWFADGFVSLVAGSSVLLLSFCLLYSSRGLREPLSIAIWLAAFVVSAFLGLRHDEIVDRLKARTTYQRTGYVQPPPANDETDTTWVVTLSLSRTEDKPHDLEAHRSRLRRRRHAMMSLVWLAALGLIIIQARWTWSVGGMVIGLGLWIASEDYGWTNRSPRIPCPGFMYHDVRSISRKGSRLVSCRLGFAFPARRRMEIDPLGGEEPSPQGS